MKRNLLLSTVFLWTALFYMCAPSYASATYSVSPLVIDKTLEGRDIVTVEITVSNTGSTPITVFPTVNNISLDEGGTIQEFLQPVESDRTTSLSSWIEISRLGIDLRSGESKVFPVTLRIHSHPVPGTYHALIGFGTGSIRDEAEQQVMSGIAPGTLVTVTIPDNKIQFLKLSKFIVDKFVTHTENQAATFTFTNPGDEALIPTGEVIFYDGLGKEVGVARINVQDEVIKPGEEKSFNLSVPTDGLFGRYKAFLSVEYGTTQRASIHDTSFFYVFPIMNIGMILFTLLIFIAIFAWYIHSKYFDTRSDESERLTLHFRTTQREPKDHDIDLKETK